MIFITRILMNKFFSHARVLRAPAKRKVSVWYVGGCRNMMLKILHEAIAQKISRDVQYSFQLTPDLEYFWKMMG